MNKQEAIKELELIAEVTMWNDRRLAVEMAIQALSAERTGEWILDGGTPICSVCHGEPCWSSEGYDFTDFCPNCGAKMGGDKE